MKVVDLNGVYHIDNIEDLEAALVRTYEDRANSFWLSDDREEYPALSLLVREGVSSLHYVPREREAGFRSRGHMPGRSKTGSMSFMITGGGERVEVLNDALIPFSAALGAAKEFFLSNELPKSVEWVEL